MIIYPCSSEPTFVNGTRIPDSVPLHPDDIITIGRGYKLQFVVPYYERPDDGRPIPRNRAQPDKYYRGTINSFTRETLVSDGGGERRRVEPRIEISDNVKDMDSLSSDKSETVFGVKGSPAPIISKVYIMNEFKKTK